MKLGCRHKDHEAVNPFMIIVIMIGSFNQEKALVRKYVGAFSVIVKTSLYRDLHCDCENFSECSFKALISTKQALHLMGTQVKSVSNKQSDVFLSMCPAAGL